MESMIFVVLPVVAIDEFHLYLLEMVVTMVFSIRLVCVDTVKLAVYTQIL